MKTNVFAKIPLDRSFGANGMKYFRNLTMNPIPLASFKAYINKLPDDSYVTGFEIGSENGAIKWHTHRKRLLRKESLRSLKTISGRSSKTSPA